MNTTPSYHPKATTEDIHAYEILYQQALKTDQQFHVLKDIRQAINKLKKNVESGKPLSVSRVLDAKERKG